jgi:hypothetical protein
MHFRRAKIFLLVVSAPKAGAHDTLSAQVAARAVRIPLAACLGI